MKGVFIMSITSMFRGKSRKGQWVKLPNVIEVEGITLLCGSSGFIVKQSDDGLTADDDRSGIDKCQRSFFGIIVGEA